MSQTNITLAAASPSDYLAIARLESAAFAHEEFGKVALGPHRLTEAAKHAEAKRLSRPPKLGETNYHTKAVAVIPDGTEEIVGFAGWTACIGRTGSEEEKARLGTKESWAQAEMEKEKDEKVKDEKEYGNAKLRGEAFGKGDEILARATQGKDYMTLFVLVVLPKYQRKGIGAMLFEHGLKVADEAGLQVVLGASDQGIGLYKKYGCVEVERMHLKLWEYAGGEGLGVTTHIFLRRPAALAAASKTL